MRLGEGFTLPPVHVEPEPHRPSLEELRNEQLLVAIAALQDALLSMPRPEVHVEAPDLTAIVQAVTGLKPGATSEDIASAVVRQISPTSQTDVAEVLSKVVKALEKLDFRMQGAGGGGSVALASSNITDRADRQLGEVSVINLPRTEAYSDAYTGGFLDAVAVAGVVEVANFPAAPTSTEISNDSGNPIPVSGTVAVSNPTPQTDVSSLAKDATLQNVFAAVDTLESLTGQLVTATQALLTNSQLRAAPIITADRDVRVSGALTVAAAITTTGTASTTGTLVVPADGMSGFAVQVVATTAPAWAGSVVTEYSADNGVTWTATAWRQTVTGTTGNTLTSAMTVNNGSYTGALLRGVLAGATHYRVRLATNTAGSVQASLVAHENTGAVFSNTVLDTRSTFQYLCSAAGGRVGFNATIDAVTSSTTAQLLAAFQNPAASGVDLTIYRVEFGSSVAAKIRRSRNGTLTVGTAQTPAANVNRGGGANTSVGQLYPGTRGLVLNTAVTGATLAKVTYVGASVDDADNVDGTLTLRPGEIASWTVQTAAGTGDASLFLAWAQTAAAV